MRVLHFGSGLTALPSDSYFGQIYFDTPIVVGLECIRSRGRKSISSFMLSGVTIVMLEPLFPALEESISLNKTKFEQLTSQSRQAMSLALVFSRQDDHPIDPYLYHGIVQSFYSVPYTSSLGAWYYSCLSRFVSREYVENQTGFL